MHPYFYGEVARLRALELAREAAAYRQHRIPRPAREAALIGDVGLRRSQRASPAGTAGVLRHYVGWALIRVGMRFVDPVKTLHDVRP